MQTLTIAIGQSGINYFCQQFVSSPLLSLISNMTVPDRLINVGSFQGSGSGMGTDYSDVKVQLTSGRLVGFQPAFRSVTQQASGNEFLLELAAPAFSAQYKWEETGRARECIQTITGGISCQNRSFDHTYDYSPGFDELRVRITTAFQFNTGNNAYEIVERGNTVEPGAVSANIPSSSVVRNEIQGCLKTEVSDVTRQSVSEIDFAGKIGQLIPPLLHSIPASGNLGHDIVFDFGLGDSGLKFSTQAGFNGLQIGITGRARYRDQAYPELPTEVLALPTVLSSSDPYHLQTYVSGYSINGLQWAFFQAGLLHANATRYNIPDPNALKCSTYAPISPLFADDFADDWMSARIVPAEPPRTSFQNVWILDEVTLARIRLIEGIQSVLPALESMAPCYYLTQATFETALTKRHVSQDLIDKIVVCARQIGMVMHQTLDFIVTIETADAPKPEIRFSVTRDDLLRQLRLGLVEGSTAQTLQFDYKKVQAKTTYLSNTVPGWEDKTSADFGAFLWLTVEGQYDNCLIKMGENGVPLPMMHLFKFVFANAETSIQEGFVSIKAKVQL